MQLTLDTRVCSIITQYYVSSFGRPCYQFGCHLEPCILWLPKGLNVYLMFSCVLTMAVVDYNVMNLLLGLAYGPQLDFGLFVAYPSSHLLCTVFMWVYIGWLVVFPLVSHRWNFRKDIMSICRIQNHNNIYIYLAVLCIVIVICTVKI